MQNIHPLVYNCSTNESMIPSRLMAIEIGNKIVTEYPFEDIIWAPGIIITQNHFFYYILVLLLHAIPAIFIDGLLRIAGKSPR